LRQKVIDWLRIVILATHHKDCRSTAAGLAPISRTSDRLAESETPTLVELKRKPTEFATPPAGQRPTDAHHRRTVDDRVDDRTKPVQDLNDP
jgi:hypothetical protein